MIKLKKIMKNLITNLLTGIALCLAMAGCAVDYAEMDRWDASVIPVEMTGIEAVNIDNSGELPIVSNLSIKKEAYMVGVKWITENTVSDNDNKFITGPIRKGTGLYNSLGDRYSKAIKCNDQFSTGIPAGQYVSKFFKEIDRKYLPVEINEGFVLLVAPDPGEHSFRVEYYEGNVIKFFYDTTPVNFY